MLLTEDPEIVDAGLNAFCINRQDRREPLVSLEKQKKLCQEILRSADHWQNQLATAHLHLQDADSSCNQVLGGMSAPQDFLPSQLFIAHETMRLAQSALSSLLSRPDLAECIQLAQPCDQHAAFVAAKQRLHDEEQQLADASEQLQLAETALEKANQDYLAMSRLTRSRVQVSLCEHQVSTSFIAQKRHHDKRSYVQLLLPTVITHFHVRGFSVSQYCVMSTHLLWVMSYQNTKHYF